MENTKKELSLEELTAKAAEIGLALNCKVIPLAFVDEDTDEQIVAFVKQPNRMQKLRALDKSIKSPVFAAEELFTSIIIKEHSDPRITSEREDCDKYYLGAVMASISLVNISVDTLKKK